MNDRSRFARIGQRGQPADCPREGQALVYHDHRERINYPLKRVGKRGSGRWEQITWDQAMEEIAAKLIDVRKRHGPEAVLTMGSSPRCVSLVSSGQALSIPQLAG